MVLLIIFFILIVLFIYGMVRLFVWAITAPNSDGTYGLVYHPVFRHRHEEQLKELEKMKKKK